MPQTKYTFLLPAYKAKYFDEALVSIKSQTFKDFKVIVSDDCSPEDLKSVFDKVVGDDPRFEFRRNEVNMGGKSLVSHWNLLVDLCDTEFLIMASDDDVYDVRFLEEINTLTEKYPEVNLYRARVKQIDAVGDVTRQDLTSEEYEDKVAFVYDFICMDKIKCIANYVFRTTKLKSCGSFVDIPLAWGSDDATIFNVIENGACQTADILFSFRCSGENISTVANKNMFVRKNDALYQFLQFMVAYFNSLSAVSDKLAAKRIERSKAFFFSGYHIKSMIYGMQFDSFGNVRKYTQFLASINAISGSLEKLHIYWSWLKASGLRWYGIKYCSCKKSEKSV